MSRTWVLDFARPDDWVTLNGREHWAAKAALTKTWRHATKTYAQQARIPHLERAHIIAQPCFTSTSTRRRDAGNWSLTAKACVDGLVDAGVLDDDDDEHLVGPDMRRGPVVKGLARIRITITELHPTEGAA